MAKRLSLRDDVLANIPRKGFEPWHKSLPSDIRQEVEQLRADFHAGRLGAGVTKTGLSHTLAKALRDRGVLIGHAGVRKWIEDGRAKS